MIPIIYKLKKNLKVLSSSFESHSFTTVEVKKLTSLIHKFFLKFIDQLLISLGSIKEIPYQLANIKIILVKNLPLLIGIHNKK